jgi:hypothetical protein
MPVPIAPMNNYYTQEAPREMTEPADYMSINWSMLDGLVPEKSGSSKNKTKISSSDASFLFKFWKESDNDGSSILSNSEKFNNSDVLRLKALGFVSGETDDLKFTERAKEVIKNIVLSQNNDLLKGKVDKPYTEILAEMDARKKSGIRLSMDS